MLPNQWNWRELWVCILPVTPSDRQSNCLSVNGQRSKLEVPRDVRNSKGPYTWQVQERMVSTLEQTQVPNGTGPDVRRSKRPLLASRTHKKLSILSLALLLPFTELWEVSMDHLGWLYYAKMLTLLETWSRPIWFLQVLYLLRSILSQACHDLRTLQFEHPKVLMNILLKEGSKLPLSEKCKVLFDSFHGFPFFLSFSYAFRYQTKTW